MNLGSFPIEGIKKNISRFPDLISAVFLGIYAVFIVGPLGFLRAPLLFERFCCYGKVFVKLGLLTKAVKVAIDWRLGLFDGAISQSEEVIEQIENDYLAKPDSCGSKKVLLDLYAILARAHMHLGHIDDSMSTILRTNKKLGVRRLPGLANIDVKTAHLLRAALAAGRLLDGNGLATMFVKPGEEENRPASFTRDQGSEFNNKPNHPTNSKSGATIIPFPGL